jgi:hypothetical protein
MLISVKIILRNTSTSSHHHFPCVDSEVNIVGRPTREASCYRFSCRIVIETQVLVRECVGNANPMMRVGLEHFLEQV